MPLQIPDKWYIGSRQDIRVYRRPSYLQLHEGVLWPKNVYKIDLAKMGVTDKNSSRSRTIHMSTPQQSLPSSTGPGPSRAYLTIELIWLSCALCLL